MNNDGLTWEARWASGLMVNALDSGSSGPGSRLGRGTMWCSWARHFTLTVPLSIQVCNWVLANLMLGVNPSMDYHPIHGGAHNFTISNLLVSSSMTCPLSPSKTPCLHSTFLFGLPQRIKQYIITQNCHDSLFSWISRFKKKNWETLSDARNKCCEHNMMQKLSDTSYIR